MPASLHTNAILIGIGNNNNRGNSSSTGMSETGVIIVGSIFGGILGCILLFICIGVIYANCSKTEINHRKKLKEEKERKEQEILDKRIEYTAKIKNITIDEARLLPKGLLHPIGLIPISTHRTYHQNQNLDTVINISHPEPNFDKFINNVGIINEETIV